MEEFQIEIYFGAISPKLSEQLAKQNLTIEEKELERLQRAADNVTFLTIHHFMTKAETRKAQSRIFKAIQKGARPL